MVRRGPRSRLEDVEKAIIRLFEDSNARVHGLGFREIHRKLQTNPERSRAGSFTTLKKCLRNLERKYVLRRDPMNKKYTLDFLFELYARKDRDLVMKTISEANIFGGSRLFHPKLARTKTIEKPKIFGATCAFIKADLRELGWGFRDEGFLTLEQFEGRWSGSPPRRSGWLTAKTRELARTGARRSPPYILLTNSQLNAARAIETWLRKIWTFAKDKHIVREDVTPETITDEELERLWQRLFKKVETIVIAEYIDPQQLLKWLKTSEGKDRFTKTLNAKHLADAAKPKSYPKP